jgi:hypothetical protein
MDKKTSNQIIIEALNIAIQKGCYDLIAVTNIVNALKFLNDETNGQSTPNNN